MKTYISMLLIIFLNTLNTYSQKIPLYGLQQLDVGPKESLMSTTYSNYENVFERSYNSTTKLGKRTMFNMTVNHKKYMHFKSTKVRANIDYNLSPKYFLFSSLESEIIYKDYPSLLDLISSTESVNGIGKNVNENLTLRAQTSIPVLSIFSKEKNSKNTFSSPTTSLKGVLKF